MKKQNTQPLNIISVLPTQTGMRADVFLCRAATHLSRQRAAQVIADELVRVDGRKITKGAILLSGQQVEIYFAETEADFAIPDSSAPLEILYEDERLVAINKPAGFHCVPQTAAERGTIAQALLERFPQMAEIGFSKMEPGICHRLDFWTSGCLLAAKERSSFEEIRLAFERHQVRKEYMALCVGEPPDAICIEAPILHSTRRSKRVRVGAVRGRGAIEARTEFITLARMNGLALVKVFCSTGAMHQIRAHAAHAGYPLVGDELYHGAPEPSGRFWLHASMIEISGLSAGGSLKVEAPLPMEFKRRLEKTGYIFG